MAYIRSRYTEIGMALETAFGTEKLSGFTYFPVEPTYPSLARSSQASPGRTAKFGGFAPNLPGTKDGGTVDLVFPLRGAAANYDESSSPETSFPVERDLILSALGCDASNAPEAIAYAATGMDTSPNAYTPTVDTGADVAGKFFACDGPAYGFVSESASGATAAYTLAQAGTDTTPSANGDILPAYTGFVSGQPVASYTLRMRGEETEHGVILIGCLPESVAFSFEAGQVPTCTITMRFTDHKIDDTIGGLGSQEVRRSLPPVLSGANGRIVVGTASGGTKRCGMIASSITISNSYSAVPCLDKPGGVNVVRNDCEVTMAMSAAWDSSDTVTNNEHEWEYLLDSRSTEAFGVYVGTGPGDIMGFFMPAGTVREQPTLTDNDGIGTWEFTATASGQFEATHDASDSANDAATSVFLWGFA
jgi:hypothetical protein